MDSPLSLANGLTLRIQPLPPPALCIMRSSLQERIIVIKSRERIGQVCPISMGVYGIALVPLG